MLFVLLVQQAEKRDQGRGEFLEKWKDKNSDHLQDQRKLLDLLQNKSSPQEKKLQI